MATSISAEKVSSKWTAVQKPDAKRIIAPPTSEDYNDWNMDQLKLECTSRQLHLTKNTKKSDRVGWLQLSDSDKTELAAQLQKQREQRNSHSGKPIDDRRSPHCMFRLLNVLFSELFFTEFLSSGDQWTRAELDAGGRNFWDKVAAGFNESNTAFDELLSDSERSDVFDGINPSQAQTHSSTKLYRMWREVAGKFAKAESNSKVSGQHSTDFWKFCNKRVDVYYLHLWTLERGAGREFCSGNFFSDDEEDSTHPQKKKQRKATPVKLKDSAVERAVSSLAESVARLVERDTVLARDQATLAKLGRLEARLDRVSATLREISKDIAAKKQVGEDVGEDLIERERTKKRKRDLEAQIDELEETF